MTRVAALCLLLTGCANWPPPCAPGEQVETVATDLGPYYICRRQHDRAN
jgi:hypothetical protein